MWCRLALCALLGGCGFHSRAGLTGDLPTDGDAPGSDAPGTGTDGGSGGTTDCFQRWFDGAPSLAFSTPQGLTALATDVDTRDPWFSADGLRLYFTRNPSTVHGKDDVYLAKRSSTAVDFTMVSAMDNLDTSDDDGRVSLDGDETLLVMSSNHTASGKFQILATTRSDMGQPLPSPSATDQALVASVNTNNDYFDPFLTRDGLKLYVAPILPGAPQQIRMATRAPGQNFGPSMPVPVINSGNSIDADPALSLDERIIVFSSKRPAGGGLGATNLWYATRQHATDDFTAPRLIPMVNSNSEDGDPVLSADGCELYFASTRLPGGKYQLFHAQVMK